MKSASSNRPEPVTEEEFLSWPEATNKIELIDGFVVRSPAPTYDHQEILGRLIQRLRNWAEGRGVTVGHSPCDIRIAPGRIVQPDVFVILERIPRRLRGPITRVPELCVEVLSRDVGYDRMTKRLLYAAAGVRELWVISGVGWLERWTGPGLAHSEGITDTLRTPLLDGFELEVASLFAEE